MGNETDGDRSTRGEIDAAVALAVVRWPTKRAITLSNFPGARSGAAATSRVCRGDVLPPLLKREFRH